MLNYQEIAIDTRNYSEYYKNNLGHTESKYIKIVNTNKLPINLNEIPEFETKFYVTYLRKHAYLYA